MPEWDLDTPEGMYNAIVWTRRFIDMMNEGAVWAVPRSGAVYRIHKATQVLELLSGTQSDRSIERVFRAMGWTVTHPQ